MKDTQYPPERINCLYGVVLLGASAGIIIAIAICLGSVIWMCNHVPGW